MFEENSGSGGGYRHHKRVKSSDLIKVNESNLLILASGGPLLVFNGYTKNKTVKVIQIGEFGQEIHHEFKAETLRRLVPFRIGDF